METRKNIELRIPHGIEYLQKIEKVLLSCKTEEQAIHAALWAKNLAIKYLKRDEMYLLLELLK